MLRTADCIVNKPCSRAFTRSEISESFLRLAEVILEHTQMQAFDYSVTDVISVETQCNIWLLFTV
jgi:hypothetical protein